MTERREMEILTLINKHCEVFEGEFVIKDIHELAKSIDDNIVKNTRCAEKLKGFITYMNQNKDQRFMQGVKNFMEYPFLLSAKELDNDTGSFNGLQDTYYEE